MMALILDLCGGTGSWSAPYRAGGYRVIVVTPPEFDVRTFSIDEPVHGILAAPPCTEFASSGARWWASKPPHLLTDAIEIVRACLALVEKHQPAWWVLENPSGRIRTCVPELRAPSLRFDPCDFGDPYTKRTYLWGRFNHPVRNRIEPTENKFPGSSPIHRMPPGPDRQRLRSMTPPGFSKAFFEANP